MIYSTSLPITFDQKLAEFLNNLTVGENEWPIGNFLLCGIAMILAVLLCGIIGYEREKRGRSAGLRTHLLVGVGSCIIMIISIYGFPKLFYENDYFERDVARLAAAVVTGVGFLGAGAIIHRNNGTKGLTTASTIWLVMAIGLACGSFNFILAITGTGLILIVLTLFRRFEVRLNRKSPLIIISVSSEKPALKIILEACAQFHCSAQELTCETVEGSDGAQIEITFQAVFEDANPLVNDFVCKLEESLETKSIQVLNHKR